MCASATLTHAALFRAAVCCRPQALEPHTLSQVVRAGGEAVRQLRAAMEDGQRTLAAMQRVAGGAGPLLAGITAVRPAA